MSSEHDKAVLNCIFNPLLPIGEYIHEEGLPQDLSDNETDTALVREARNLEVEGIKNADLGNLDKAIELFTQAINIAPQRASSYNNRAQAYRLKGKASEGAADLEQAVQLSGGQGRSGCQALCQRGILHRKEGRDDLARKDFEAAAKLGSQFAKIQLVELNPYAALCNQMLHDVMEKLQKGQA